MGSFAYRIARILFIICNFLFLGMGVALLVIGGYLQVSRSSYVDLMPSDEFFTATALLIASGVIVVVVCFLGFLGIWMESQCLMLIYFLCVLVILALAIASGIIAYIFHGEIEDKLQDKLLEGLRDPKKRKDWDKIQDAERCCGVKNYTDWYGLVDKDYPKSIPDTCCDGPNCGIQGETVAYDESCYQKGRDWVTENFYTLGATGICLGILQIILLVSSLSLIIAMRREKMLV